MAKRDYRRGELPYSFIAIPKEVLNGEDWQRLSHSARVLALDLCSQYSGKANGRLSAAFTLMQTKGWVSKGTLSRAKQDLLTAKWVVRTRKGHAPHTAEWFAFTWWTLDYHPSMDIDPKCFPKYNFMSIESKRIDPNANRHQASGPRFERSRNETDGKPSPLLVPKQDR
jgi:hypothetical protein